MKPTKTITWHNLTTHTEEAITMWLGAKTSPNTRRAYSKSLSLFTSWLEQTGSDLQTATPSHVELWQTWLNGNSYSSATICRHLSAVSSFYNHANKPGRIFEGRINPASTISADRIKRSSKPTKAITSSQVKKLLEAASDAETKIRDQAVILILACVGVRVGELCNATVNDLDISDKHYQLTLVGKGKKARVVTLPLEVSSLLTALHCEQNAGSRRVAVWVQDSPLIQDNQGNSLNPNKVRRILERLSKAAELPFLVSPHMLRATMITEALLNNAPLWAVQDLVGHSDPRTTDSYRRRGQSSVEQHALVAKLATRYNK